jgi:hypothetical protein
MELQQQQQQQQLWPCCCPEALPDFESAGACWVSVQELQQLPLRSPSEPCKWFVAMADGTAEQLPLYSRCQQSGRVFSKGFLCHSNWGKKIVHGVVN